MPKNITKNIGLNAFETIAEEVERALDGLQDEDRDRVVQALDIVQDIVLSKYNEE
tara:strand:+ start:86 stop:250 length:165 start_codon:yes stop_codon:yes gene_type:complete